MVSPEMVAAVFIIGGIGAAASYVIYRAVDAIGPDLEPGDLLPAAPWQGPPVPRFMLKPALLNKAYQAAGLGLSKGE